MFSHSHRFSGFGLLAGLSMFLLACPVMALDDAAKIRSGKLACGGNHFSRVPVDEEHRTSYSLRHLGDSGVIEIHRIVLFDATGGSLFDYPGDALPPLARTVLEPHQSTQFNTRELLAADLDAEHRPIQMHVEWSYQSRRRGIALNGSTVRTVRDAGNGAERSRASSECRLIAFRR